MTQPTPTLTIYVMEHCRGCERARRNADEVRNRYPGVRVEVVDLGRDAAPPEVFSVPTYVLDGRVVSLGNPRFDALVQLLNDSAGGRHVPDGQSHEA